MSEELREAMADALMPAMRDAMDAWTESEWEAATHLADALLSGPLAPLLAAQAAVERVRALADAIERDWEAVYEQYDDDDTASLIRGALASPAPQAQPPAWARDHLSGAAGWPKS